MPSTLYALDFKKSDYDTLLANLANVYPVPLLRSNKGLIKQAIIDHFAQTYQKISFSVYENSIEVIKNFAMPEKDETFDRALFRCDLKLIEIKTNPKRYRPVDILWAIPYDRRVELFEYFESLNLSSDDIKEIVRVRMELCFGLDETEIVLFLRNNIYIRKNVSVKSKSSQGERRFAGKSSEELEAFCAQYFANGVWEEIESMLPDTLQDRLNFSNITNRRFIKTFTPVFRSMVEILIHEKIKDIGKEDVIAISGFILRKHFDSILIFTANNLLEFVEKRDKNAEEFIKYYNGDVVIDDEGNRIVQHAIMDTHNQKWNYSSILATLIQWKESKARTHTYEERLKKLVERQEIAYQALQKVQPAKEGADREIEAQKDAVNSNRKAFKKLKAECERSAKAMQENRERLVIMRDRDKSLIADLRRLYETHDKTLKQYGNRQTEYQNWQKQIADHAKQFKEILEQKKIIKSNYSSIVKGLITAFAKR